MKRPKYAVAGASPSIARKPANRRAYLDGDSQELRGERLERKCLYRIKMIVHLDHYSGLFYLIFSKPYKAHKGLYAVQFLILSKGFWELPHFALSRVLRVEVFFMERKNFDLPRELIVEEYF